MPEAFDAVVVGAGPNGLAAAIEIAEAGRSVLVLEAAAEVGGGSRTQELTLPGYLHDTCSGIHPMGAASPFFRSLPLERYGLEWVHPEIPIAHPLDDGSAVFAYRSLEDTAENLGRDAGAYRKLMGPLVNTADKIVKGILGQLIKPRHPIAMARFGKHSVRSARSLLQSRFQGERVRALLAGNAAHSLLTMETRGTGGLALIYNVLAHTVGFPFPRGGSQAIADALAAHLRSLGGVIECNRPVQKMSDIPASKVVLFDLAPRHVATLAREHLPSRYLRALNRFRYGPGVFKVDWALDGPIPWKDPDCAKASTLHLGGTFEEIATSEADVVAGRHPQRPWVIIANQTVFDETRAPTGKHTVWGYCHVPSGSKKDMTTTIENQVERFAPGFRDLVLARHTRNAAEMEAHNPNYIGGDISSGRADLKQLIARPVARWTPHSTPNGRIYLCSQSTPPGPGVHGMCGMLAAKAALRRLR